jgi:hypothetical protein
MQRREILVLSLVVMGGLVVGVGLQNLQLDLPDLSQDGSGGEIVTQDPNLTSFSAFEDRIPETADNHGDVPMDSFSEAYGPWIGSPIKYVPEELLSDADSDALLVYPSGSRDSPGDGNIIQIASLPETGSQVVMNARHARDILGAESQCENYNVTGFVSVAKWEGPVPDSLGSPGVEGEIVDEGRVNKTKEFTLNGSKLVMEIPDRFEGKNIGLYGGVTPETVECGFRPHKVLELERLYVETVN